MPRWNLCAVGLLQAALLLLRLLYKKRDTTGESLPTVQHSFGRPWRTTGQILGVLSPTPTSWPDCTSPLKALFDTVSMERGIAGITMQQHHLPFLMPHLWLQERKGQASFNDKLLLMLLPETPPCAEGWFQVFTLSISGGCRTWVWLFSSVSLKELTDVTFKILQKKPRICRASLYP